MTLGSLFDGSGGFPLAGSLCGIEPKWAAEVEPYPIAVTRSRFPNMKHLGSVTEVHGGEIEPVDIITFGSPCQDLSVAGKRAGLKHEANGDNETTRSGLFMEAVRIIREMREATNGVYPTFALWENVPGAFSSNGGEDFRTVLEELIRIVEPNAAMPPVPKAGWAYADSFRGDGWSLAYRVFDAQHWGVPQRRRRIHLVLDLGGQRAREVLFEREGVQGYFAQGRMQGQGTADDAQRSVGANDRDGTGAGDGRGRGLAAVTPYTLKICSGCEGGGKGALIQEDNSATLASNNDQYLSQPVGLWDSIGGQAERGWVGEIAPTLKAVHYKCAPLVAVKSAGFKGNQGPKARGVGFEVERSCTLNANRAGLEPTVCIKERSLFEDHSQDTRYKGPLEVSPMLPAQLGTGGNNTPFVVEGEPIPIHDMATRFAGKRGDKQDGKGNGFGDGQTDDPMNTLTSADRHAVAYCVGNGQLNQMSMVEQSNTLDCMHDQQAVLVSDKEAYNSGANATGGRYIVRRLTPTECARLQGFPDNWGHLDVFPDWNDEDYRFWLGVRNTHAAINGKAVKEYTEKQMVTWYNKLHTDSAEYKMWGNGIALPPALYCMQGMAAVLEERERS